ncbi:inner centromere protein-like isoform X2 [Pogonomyrmex barbatus]|uniref:Inner centromere protein-like isoform X2 n=1 Tax=Pogonomyrmex barbatus TaxID=144034 RepID=A0A6I9WWQ7_9HYME|nr:inner centromere protein-like isoform X2 [Pogonomyrmex barbatus]
MNARSKDEIRDKIFKDLQLIHNRRVELSNRLKESLEENLLYVHELFTQLSQPSSGPLIPKTPKILRKKAPQPRIETILEDEVLQQETISPKSSPQSVKEEERKESEVVGTRLKRRASKKAADNIKKQSIILQVDSAKKVKRDSQVKRKKSASSSDEENSVSKYSKIENQTEAKDSTRRLTKKKSKQMDQVIIPVIKTEEIEKEDDNLKVPIRQRSSRSNSKDSQNREEDKVDDTIVAPNADDAEEPSMYEDAIGRPIPIMNSTLKHSLHTPGTALNATVVLERLPQQSKLNETVVIQKAINMSNSKKSKEKQSVQKELQDNTQVSQAPVQYSNYNGLITEDESSPEVKKPKKLEKKQNNKKQVKNTLLTSSDDEIPNTPVKTRLRDAIAPAIAQESKSTYKSNALFSPYAKESVKKRVEAFEQAVMYSPKPVDVDVPTRMTRTKTRAMATKETETDKNTEKSVAQILARKSLAKAKKISLAKEKKDNDDFKENKEQLQLPKRINQLFMSQPDKLNTKQTQLKTTPLSKMKLMQPSVSVNRLHTPINTQNLSNYTKALTASRTNIVTGVESFIQPPKSITKTNSVEKLEEKKRHEEDARKKREETLRLQTEEKRRKRQEKELKNKLAREAKEKQELEKRQKTEKEREERAKLALLMQEKQREEMEKKRLLLQQRVQEKEERRKLEEQQRLQRLQEQEETERLLAEQKRREQEAEKRREAEARAQQAAEVLKQKNQILAAQAKCKQQAHKHQDNTNYVIDSEPNDDESDDESRPKHKIPLWALSDIRKSQLAMQIHIPQGIIYEFFDTRKCTPDLTELFQNIDRSRLKRTSSAIWKTPPRISMMETEFVQPKII